MTNKKAAVVVVIVTYNSHLVVEFCLRSLGKKVAIVVVDNASTDGTREIVRSKFPWVTLIMNSRNQGYAGGNNQGIEYALSQHGDYILITNPDVLFLADTLKKLFFVAEQDRGRHMYAPLIVGPDKKTVWSAGGVLDKKRYSAKLIQASYTNDQISSKNRIDFISGTCMLIPRKLLVKGLRFYEPYFMYYEDVEFCLEATKRGFPPQLVDVAPVVHAEQSELGKAKATKEYYLARNHLLFVARNAPTHIKLREFIRQPKTLFEHLGCKEYMAVKGMRDYYLRKFGRYGE